jgi:hypothetical protein
MMIMINNFTDKIVLFSRVSDDFPSNSLSEMSCQNRKQQSSASYTVNLNDISRSEAYICDVSSLFGFIMIHNRDDFSSDKFTNILRNRSETFVLKPKITTTDENLKSVSPEKYLNI